MSDETSCSCHGNCATGSAADGVNKANPVGTEEGPRLCSTFLIPGMDCPSEEQMIRLCLADVPTSFMKFDLPGRSLAIGHAGNPQRLVERLTPLGYGAELRESRPLQSSDMMPVDDDATEASVLWALLGINALMFVTEAIAGWWADSAGLLSDAADMAADAAVYGVALYAVGRGARRKLSAARIAGWLQLVLAIAALSETGRRVITGSAPEAVAMVAISLLALAANVWCLVLIASHRHRGVHMRASYLFSANDVLANLGVILAGVLVSWLGSSTPDWIIGFAIGTMVLIGAIRILRLR